MLQFEEEDECWRDIRVVHYDDNGMPFSYSEAPAAVSSDDCESTNGLKAELWSFNNALLKPVLKPSDFPDHRTEYSTDGDAK